MNTKTILTATTILAASLISAQAGPKEEVAEAISNLAKQANYSWTSTTKRPEPAEGADARGRGGPSSSSGKTANGLILTVRTMGDRSFETLRKGEKSASKRDGVWTVREPRAEGDARRGDQEQGQRGNRNRGGFGDSSRTPDVQAQELLEKVGELKKEEEGGAYVGELTEENAKSLLSFGGGRRGGGDNAQQRPEVMGAKGTAKFWVKDGVLAKYETSVSGAITFNGNERDLGRVTTVELADVGTAKVEAPEEAKKLLSGE
jgi:hypothetical protein